MTSVEHFIPSTATDAPARGITAYVEAYTARGDLVVDPFCQSPYVVLEVLRTGRRVISTSVNPLDVLRARLTFMSVPARELQAATTHLSDSPKFGTTLREHLQHLYRTVCPHCGKPAVAQYYVWESAAKFPQRVNCRCSACGQAGLHDCDDLDRHVLEEIQPRGLHYWHMLDRAARDPDRGRRFTEKLLELYTPRNLYALSNLLLKTDDLFGDVAIRDWIRLLLLDCFELGSSLNTVPGETPAPHAGLEPPVRFVEWNVWQLFENGASRLVQTHVSPTLTLATQIEDVARPQFPMNEAELSRQPLAYVGHLSASQLAQELEPGSAQLVFYEPLQPGRARWALTYLWTGWLYGHAEAAALWPLVKRRVSDWSWYLKAMRAILWNLHKALASTGHIVLLGQGKGLPYYEALSLAAAGANLRVQSALYHPTESEIATRPFAGLRGDYRITWTPSAAVPAWPMPTHELGDQIRDCASTVAEETLELRAEPAPFVRLHCAIWEALARRNLLRQTMLTRETIELPDWVREQIQNALEAQVGRIFVRLWKDQEQQECLWWLLRPPVNVQPLTERVELAVYDVLATAPAIDISELAAAVFARFPLALTPDLDWVMACVKSYGQVLASGQWGLRPADRAEQRAAVRRDTVQILNDLGQRLGYQVAFGTEGMSVHWSERERKVHTFLLLDSLALSQVFAWSVVSEPQHIGFVLMPAARQNLLHSKFARFPWLRVQLASQGWQFMHIEDLPDWASRTTRDRTQLTLI